MKLFKGTACFSPSVSSELKEAWTEHGGTMARTMQEKQYSDWFFCDGMGDPWTHELSKRPIVVFHANWIQAVVSSRFPIPLSDFVLDACFENAHKIEHPNTRRYHTEDSESAASGFPQASDEQNAIAANSPTTTGSQGLEKRGRSMSPGHLGSLSRPFSNATSRATELEHKIPDYHNGPQLNRAARTLHMSQSPICDRVQSDAYAAGSDISNSEGQAYEHRYQSFSVEPRQASDNLVIYPEKIAIPPRDTVFLHSSSRVTLPSNVWLSLSTSSQSSDGTSTISIPAARKALSGIPIDKLALFVPAQSHLGREFRYIGVDRRRTI